MLPHHAMIARTARAILFGTLVVLVIVSTWLYGGTLTEHQVWYAAMAVVAILASAVVCCGEPRLAPLPWLAGVLAAAILFGAIQLVPFSETWQSKLTPSAVELRNELHEGIDADSAGTNGTISLYPASTRRDLARLILPSALFLATVIPLGTMPWQRAFCWFLTGHGLFIGLFGIVQQLTFNGKLFWTVPLSQGGTPFASFVNRNHAAAYLNLCLAALISLVVWQFRRREDEMTEEVHVGNETQFSLTRSWGTRVIDRVSDQVASLSGAMLFLGIAAVVMVAAILCTGSRGGIAALVLAGTATAALMTFRHLHASAGVLVVTAIVGVAMTSWVGQGESVAERLEELGSDWRLAASSRWNHWRQSIAIVPDYALTGTGFGTYRYVYPLYQVESLPAWYYHAENQYLEALVEAGLPGLLLMIIAIGLALYYSIRKVHSSTTGWPAALGLGGTFATLAAALHAGVDFNLYMPANAFTLAILIGMQVAVPSDPIDPRFSSIRRVAWVLCLLITAAAATWSFSVLRSAAQVERIRREWERDTELLVRDEAIVDARIRALENIAADDADAHATMAAMHLWKYRLQAWNTLQQELGGTANAEFLWESTDPLVLHRQLHEADELGPVALAGHAALYDHVQRAAKWYQRARIHCPLRAPFYLALARIAPLVSTDELEQKCLQQAVRTAPADPEVLFEAGRLAYQAGQRSLALPWWNRSLRYSDRRLVAILRLIDATDEESLMSDFQALLAGNPQRAVEGVQVAARTPALTTKTPLLADVARNVVAETPLADPLRHFYIGRLARLTNQTDDAIDHLEEAVTARPELFPWRAELVEALLTAERYPEAYRHARVCSDGNPQSAAYRRLVQRASQGLERRD